MKTVERIIGYKPARWDGCFYLAKPWAQYFPELWRRGTC